MTYYDYSYDLGVALDYFEKALVDRWQQTIYDVVVAMEPMPPTLQRFKGIGDKGVVWEHRTGEMSAHVYTHDPNGRCAYLEWFEGGRNGKVQSINCEGKIYSIDHVQGSAFGGYDPLVEQRPESTYCIIGHLFAAAEDWAYGDRRYIFDTLPPFEHQDLNSLQGAHGALVEIATDFGPGPGGGEEKCGVPAFKSQLTIRDGVDKIFDDRDDQKSWRTAWTGTAARILAEGIFSSTKPTLINHELIANGLSTLINERAMIIHTYRQNSLGLIRAATQALGEKSEQATDLTDEWKIVQGIGMAISRVPQAAPVGGTITFVGWLGDQFLGDTKEVSFTHDPSEVAITLYDEVVKMNQALSASEADYATDVTDFRNALNEVPSTFLELQDITENNPTGKH